MLLLSPNYIYKVNEQSKKASRDKKISHFIYTHASRKQQVIIYTTSSTTKLYTQSIKQASKMQEVSLLKGEHRGEDRCIQS